MLFCVRVCYHYRLNHLGVFSSVALRVYVHMKVTHGKLSFILIPLFLCWVAAKVALVKCRDLHWAMMAHRDQRDVSLSSLRMLTVTDGANPCEYAILLFSREISQQVITTCSNLTPFVDTCRRHKLG